MNTEFEKIWRLIRERYTMVGSNFTSRLTTILTLLLIFLFSAEYVVAGINDTSKLLISAPWELKNALPIFEKMTLLKSQNRDSGDFLIRLYALNEDTTHSGILHSPADTHLGWLAKKSRSARNLSSGCLCFVGAGHLVMAAVEGIGRSQIAQDNEEMDDVYIMTGIGLAAMTLGVWQALTPTRAERAFMTLQGMTESSQKEEYAFQVLPSLARRGKVRRYIHAITSAALSAQQFADASDKSHEDSILRYGTGTIFSMYALAALLGKSREEKALERFSEDSELGTRLDIRMHKGLQFTLSFSY